MAQQLETGWDGENDTSNAHTENTKQFAEKPSFSTPQQKKSLLSSLNLKKLFTSIAEKHVNEIIENPTTERVKQLEKHILEKDMFREVTNPNSTKIVIPDHVGVDMVNKSVVVKKVKITYKRKQRKGRRNLYGQTRIL